MEAKIFFSVFLLLFLTTEPFASQNSCEKIFSALMNEKNNLIQDKFPEFTVKAISIANQIEKDNLWKKNGQYFITQSGKFKAVFSNNKKTLIYFSSGNAFVETYMQKENNKKNYWCSND